MKQENLYKSIVAGICISLGGMAKLLVGGIFGSILFSFGLISVFSFEANLFTGKAGHVQEFGWKNLGIVWLGNLIGCSIMAFFGWAACLNYTTIQLMSNGILFKSLLCGIVMYLTVDGYKNTKNIFCILLGIPLFIMCGFAHSVAYMFYLFAVGDFTIESIMLLFGVSIGNFIGCNIIPFIKEICK